MCHGREDWTKILPKKKREVTREALSFVAKVCHHRSFKKKRYVRKDGTVKEYTHNQPVYKIFVPVKIAENLGLEKGDRVLVRITPTKQSGESSDE